MSTIRNSPSSNDPSHRAEAAREANKAKPHDAPRQPPTAQTVDQFRALMQPRQGAGKNGLGGEDPQAQLRESLGDHSQAERGEERALVDRGRVQAATDQARQHAGDRKDRDDSRRSVGFDRPDAGPPAESSAMLQAQLAMRDTSAPPPAAPTSNAAAFAELIERHVRQLAVGGGSGNGEEGGQVLLRLSDQTLPGTDLLLTKTAEGWQLRADSRSRSSFDAIREAGPELMRRFAARNLGQLSIDPHFHE